MLAVCQQHDISQVRQGHPCKELRIPPDSSFPLAQSSSLPQSPPAKAWHVYPKVGPITCRNQRCAQNPVCAHMTTTVAPRKVPEPLKMQIFIVGSGPQPVFLNLFSPPCSPLLSCLFLFFSFSVSRTRLCELCPLAERRRISIRRRIEKKEKERALLACINWPWRTSKLLRITYLRRPRRLIRRRGTSILTRKSVGMRSANSRNMSATTSWHTAGRGGRNGRTWRLSHSCRCP